MNKFVQFLVEISLADHYEKYVNGKIDLSFDEYKKIAALDPTTHNDQRGKYTEWLLKFVKDKVDYDNLTHENHPIKSLLSKFAKLSRGVDINSFKSLNDFYDYTDTLEDSKKSLKKKEKDIFNMPDDIKVIDENENWICIETLTREGNIKGAQYKTSPQANWCTAYLDRDNFWESYHRRGDLLQFINKKDPFEKYQIYIEDGKIKESRDYKDQTSSVPYAVIKELPNFEDNYGEVEERPPFKYIWDEEGAAGYLLDENFDQEWDYLNRQPDEDEYDWYYEEASQNEEFQINHWDRFLKAAMDVYEYNVDRRYGGEYVRERMEHFPSYFTHPITGIEEDKEPAKEAVYDMYQDIDDNWDYFLTHEVEEMSSQDIDETDEEYQARLAEWKADQVEAFKKEYDVQISFAEYFRTDFPYEFDYEAEEISGGIDNSDEQLSFNFESILKQMMR